MIYIYADTMGTILLLLSVVLVFEFGWLIGLLFKLIQKDSKK